MRHFSFPMKLLWIAVGALTLSACATYLEANVTRFHQLPGPPAAGTLLTIEPADPEAAGLEFGRYADMVGTHLGAFGYSPADGAPPAVIARLNYGVTPQGQIVEDAGPRVGIGVGGFGGNVGGSVSTSVGLGENRGETVYARRVSLVLEDATSGERLYEGRAVSVGKSGDLARVMPYLLEALFENFPGTSGTSNEFKTKVEGGSGGQY